jgi:hypothetical protein
MIILLKRLFLLSGFLLLIFTLIGCNNKEDNRISQSTHEGNGTVTKISNQSPISQTTTNKAKEYVATNKAVESIRGINTDKDLLIAVEIKQLQQFKEQKYEKEIKKQLEKVFPDKNIEISTDQKIFIELNKLEKQVANKSLNKDQLKEKFNTIKKLINDEA